MREWQTKDRKELLNLKSLEVVSGNLKKLPKEILNCDKLKKIKIEPIRKWRKKMI